MGADTLGAGSDFARKIIAILVTRLIACVNASAHGAPRIEALG